MAADFQPPPTYAEVVVVDFSMEDGQVVQKPRFNPIWLKWFVDIAALLTAGGGGGGGLGTVTQVGLSVPSTEFTVSGSPVSTSGTLQLGKNSIDANKVAAGPTTGAAVAWTFRSLVVADLPITLTSGTYTPTLTGVSNVAASTAYQCQYMRVGNIVTVSGKADIDPTAAASTKLGISLPIASNIGAAEDCAGTAACPTIAGQSAAILGDATNDRAQMEWIAVDITNQPMYFTFTYEVI